MKKVLIFIAFLCISLNSHSLTFVDGKQVPDISEKEKIQNLEELVGSLMKAGEMGLTVNFETTAKTYGFKSFAEAVQFYAKINDVTVTVEQAKEAFTGIDKTINIEYSKQNLDKLFDIIINSNFRSADRYKKKYLKEDNYKAFFVTMNLEKELARLIKNPNMNGIAAHTWGWWRGAQGESQVINSVLGYCEDEMKKYKIPFQECFVIDLNGKNFLYDFYNKYYVKRKKSSDSLLGEIDDLINSQKDIPSNSNIGLYSENSNLLGEIDDLINSQKDIPSNSNIGLYSENSNNIFMRVFSYNFKKIKVVGEDPIYYSIEYEGYLKGRVKKSELDESASYPFINEWDEKKRIEDEEKKLLSFNNLAGLTTSDLKTLQESLKILGFYNNIVDGVYGDGTLSAFKKWIKSKGYREEFKEAYLNEILLEADDQRLEQEQLKQERLAEEELEQERLEQERLEQERLEQERLEQEKLEQERLDLENRKLSLFEKTEIQKIQFFISYTKDFVQMYPDELDIVEVAKLLLKLDPILKGELNDQNLSDYQLLKDFLKESKKFTVYEETLIDQERKTQIILVDNELEKLKSNIERLEQELIQNLDSYFASELILLIENNKDIYSNYQSLEEIKIASEKSEKLLSKIIEYHSNTEQISILKEKLKNYLPELLSTEQSEKIINQIDKIDEFIENPNPNNLNQLIKQTETFIQEEIINYKEKIKEKERLEQERLEQERLEQERLEQERLEQERLEQERLEQERLEQERLEQERLEQERLEQERLEEEERLKNQQIQLKETLDSFNLKEGFQREIVTIALSNGFLFDDISFKRGDRQIEISNLQWDEYSIEKIEIKNFNKELYQILKQGFNFKIFEIDWFDEMLISNFIANDQFDTQLNISEIKIDDLRFKDFIKNKNLITNLAFEENFNYIISSIISFSMGELEIDNLSFQNSDIKLFSQNVKIKDSSLVSLNKLEVTNFELTDLYSGESLSLDELIIDNYVLDKNELYKVLNQITNNDDWSSDLISKPATILNVYDRLDLLSFSGLKIRNINRNELLGSLDSFVLKDIEFEFLKNGKSKILSSFQLDFKGLDIKESPSISSDFSDYMNKLGYKNILMNAGIGWFWDVNSNNFGLNFNVGIADAINLEMSSEFSGIGAEFLNLNYEAMAAYFLTSFKINQIEFSIVDESIKQRLYELAALEMNMTVSQVRELAINFTNNYAESALGTSNFQKQYLAAFSNFIADSDRITISINPTTPVSIAELTPYIMNQNFDLLLEKINLSVEN